MTPSGTALGNCSGSVIISASGFNNSANWGSSSTQIGAGTTVLVCGTFTGTAVVGGNSSPLLTFQGGGAVGNPVTLLLDTTADLTSPAWGYNGAINTNGYSYITINGGGSGHPGAIPSTFTSGGIIENTCNGSSGSIAGCGTSYQQSSRGIVVPSGTGITIEYVYINNLYKRSGYGLDSVDDTAINDVYWGSNGSVSQLNISHNKFNMVGWALAGSNVTDTLTMDDNEISNMEHGTAAAPPTWYFVGNHLHDVSVWDAPCGGGCPYHHDGIHVFAGVQGNTNLLVIANNQFDGSTFANQAGDAGMNQWVFVEGYGSSNTAGMANGGQVFLVNNVCILNGSNPACLGDTGAAFITNWTIANAGSGYHVGDVLAVVQGTNTNTSMDVATINGGGGITSLSIDPNSKGTYFNQNGLTLSGGHGTNATINITVATGNINDVLANNTIISNQDNNSAASALGVQGASGVEWANNASSGFGALVSGGPATYSAIDYGFYQDCTGFNCYSINGQRLLITSYAITSNVVTFQANQSTYQLIAGEKVAIASLTTTDGLLLDGQTLTVLSTGLSSSQFEANVTGFSNIGSTSDLGTAIPQIADTGSFTSWETSNCTGAANTCDQHGGANLSSTSYLGLDAGCVAGSLSDPCAPTSGSPLHGGGVNLYTFAGCSSPNYVTGYGYLCADKNGVARPSSGAWDAGAIQFTSPLGVGTPASMFAELFGGGR